MVCRTRFSAYRHATLISHSYRDGPDGPWASYSINVGDSLGSGAGQTFRAFPGFSLSIVLLLLAADFCSRSHLSDPACIARNAYQPNASQSWVSAGKIDPLLSSSLITLTKDNRTAQVQLYGTDNVGLGPSSAGSPILVNQTVAGVVSKSFFMALFGLSNTGVDLGKGKTVTFLTEFRSIDMIPSISFSYTAGSYRRGRAPPRLILGGYDTTRFDPWTTLQADIRNTTAAFDPYQLAVNLEAITLTPNPDVEDYINIYDSGDIPVYIEPGMTINIDPVTAQIWLPVSACQTFEKAFGLEWDQTMQLYLVNASRHDWLIQTNPSITFSLSSSRSKGAIQNFTLPYSAFDLNVTYPLVEYESYYFPLKRASRSDPYILGRVFLQETYILVDYDTGHFSISQAASSEYNVSYVVPIQPQNKTTHKPTKLSAKASAGIVVGVVIASIAMALFLLSWMKKWWPFRRPGTERKVQARYEKSELHGAAVPRVEAMEKERVELEAEERVVERPERETEERVAERVELEAEERLIERLELETEDKVAERAELETEESSRT